MLTGGREEGRWLFVSAFRAVISTGSKHKNRGVTHYQRKIALACQNKRGYDEPIMQLDVFTCRRSQGIVQVSKIFNLAIWK